jgi:hypothetical protein
MVKNDDIECSANKRFKANEEYFSNFIDLIPSKIYLNVDDRKQWFNQLLKNKDKKTITGPVESDQGIDDQVWRTSFAKPVILSSFEVNRDKNHEQK